jgi:hypothetical protein
MWHIYIGPHVIMLIIQTCELNVSDYFNNNIIIYIIKYWNTWQHIICPNSDQNSCILVTCDNTYTMESKDELVFVDFFVHPIPLVVCD